MLDILGYAAIPLLAFYTFHRWGNNFFDPYLQSDDTRIVLFPFWAYHSSLFQGDALADSLRTWSPPLYRATLYLLTYFVDLLTVPKLLQLFAILWACVHSARIGHRRAGGVGALLGVYFIFHSYLVLNRTGGGLPRAFGYPALLMVLDGMDARQGRLAGLGAVLGFAIYPPAGLIAALVFGGWTTIRVGGLWIDPDPQKRAIRRLLIDLGVTAGVCFLAIAPSLRSDPGVGRLHTLEEARSMEVFGPGGRLPMIPLRSLGEAIDDERLLMSRNSTAGLLGIWVPMPRAGDVNASEYILLAGFIIVLIRRWSEALLPLLFVGAGVFGFFLANQLAFRLYNPARMISLALPVTSLGVLLLAYTHWGRQTRMPIRDRCVALLALLGFVLLQGIANQGYPHLNTNARSQKPLFDLIQTLPEDALIAGFPTHLDGVPLWGKRRILISEEASQPWFTGIWVETDRRLVASLEAYYAISPGPLRELIEGWGVTHMLIATSDLEFAGRPPSLFLPHGNLARRLAAEHGRELIWKRVPEKCRVGTAAGFHLYDLRLVMAELENPGDGEPLPENQNPPEPGIP